MGGGSCDVCKEAPSKYKCPSCRTPYCSVACFKNHKDDFCQKTTPREEIIKSSMQVEVSREEIKSSMQVEVTRSFGSLEDGTSCANDKDQLPSLAPDTTCPTQSPNTLCPTKALVAPDTTCPTQSPNTLCPTKALEVEDPSWLVDKNKLRSLVEFNEIRDALKDPGLQKMILQIDGSLEPEKELEKMMEGQAFQQFTNKILDIVSPQQ